MKNFTLNPEVKEFDFAVRCEIKDLEKLGWNWDEYHQNTADACNISLKKAEKQNRENYYVTINIKDDGYTSESWDGYNNEYGESNHTGDDESTIQDIAHLLSKGKAVIQRDYSVDANEAYVDTFVQ
jgi:hypothetical protein